ncbi:trehalase family glycosidase [Limibacter armeniacum]|uniref:MGH1-like glycoside hydrolase domain-containing protein n=1 Tax=Limibacter armeniacum TaxID=466084 RepID=UPI002FE61123
MKIVSHISFIILSCLMVLQSCTVEKEVKSGVDRYSYKNILNLKSEPDSANDYSISSFSDLGAWHSFALPKDKNLMGGFAGPFVMRQQQSVWISPSLVQLRLMDISKNKPVDLSEGEVLENDFYPGILKQTIKVENLIVKLSLIYADNRSALLKATIENTGGERKFQFGWKGNVFEGNGFMLERDANGIAVHVAKDEYVHVHFSNKGEHIVTDNDHYEYYSNTKSLDKGQVWESSAVISFTLSEDENAKMAKQAVSHIQKTDSLFAANQDRWEHYLTVLHQENGKQALLDIKQYDHLAVKSLLTLMHNWRSAAGGIYHQGIVPSYASVYFQGLWAWDSWKHAVAIAPFEGELAKDQIRAMYDYQNEEGMIADCFFRDSEIEGINWRNTKAPLSGWSIYKVFEATQDTEFLKEMYPKLLKYHEWWYQNRDHNSNGLCEYGSTDGTRIAAAWESGMDNAVRFDSAVIMENTVGAYSINQESIDLNAYLYSEKLYIAEIANVLGENEVAEKFKKEAEALKQLMHQTMYDQADGFYYDIVLENQAQVKVQGPEGWAPLYNNVATDEQAKGIVKVILDSNKFNTLMPFPTLSAADPKFNPEKGYWRGPVWLDQAYFAMKGMQQYGFESEARMMAEKLVNSAEGLTTDEPIRENYHPLTGKGLNASHFSWSAAHLLMMF